MKNLSILFGRDLDERADFIGIQLGLLVLNREEAERLLSLKGFVMGVLDAASEQFGTDREILKYGMSFSAFDYSMQWGDIADDAKEEELWEGAVDRIYDTGSPVFLDSEPPFRLSRTECDFIQLRHDGIIWATYPKHSDVKLYSHELTWDALEQAIINWQEEKS